MDKALIQQRPASRKGSTGCPQDANARLTEVEQVIHKILMRRNLSAERKVELIKAQYDALVSEGLT